MPNIPDVFTKHDDAPRDQQRIPGMPFTVSGGRDLGAGGGPVAQPTDPYRLEDEGPAEHIRNGLQLCQVLRDRLVPENVRTIGETEIDATVQDIERRLKAALAKL